MFLLPTRQHEQRDAEGIMPGKVLHEPNMFLDCFYLGKSPTACQYHHTKWSHGHVTGLKASYGFSPGHQQKWYASWTENDLACITFSSAQR